VQKDWAVVKSNQLADCFCIAVVGHEGWNQDPDATARYSLAVSFESLNKEIPIYNPMQLEIENLRQEIEAEADVEASEAEAEAT
jgi:hypothetical protein